MRRLRNFNKHVPLLRAVGVLGAVGILVSSVTYASLQSQQAVLAGNSIRSATADLRIGTSASAFSASRAGFTFADVAPGGPAMPADGHTFYLKNYGTTTLGLNVAVNSSVTNTKSVDLGKTFVQLTRVDTGAVQTLSVQSLIDGQAAGGTAVTDPIVPAAVVQYRLRSLMDADAFTGTGVDVEVDAVDLVFSGIPIL